MDNHSSHGTSYKGTKHITQQHVANLNATGFGAAADDYMERGIDLNEQLIRNKMATFFFRMNSDAMIDANILPGDMLIVDRSMPAENEKIVIAVINGELVVRRLLQHFSEISLTAANKKYAVILINHSVNYKIWGVVTYVIHVIS